MENAKQETKIVRAFRAYSNSKYAAKVADTPKEAAEAFFVSNPGARKCDVTEGKIEITDGIEFFVTTFGNCFSSSGAPQSWRDVTKKTAAGLIDAKADGAQKV